MAVVTTKSALITARDSTPTNKSSLQTGPRRLYEQVATVEVGSADSIGSKYVLFSIRSCDRVSALVKKSDAITSAAADFGLYRTTADGGAVVSVSAFGSAVSLATADVTGTDITHESGTYDISEIEMPVWQFIGLTADPGLTYDVVATLTAAATAAGTLTVHCQYSQGN